MKPKSDNAPLWNRLKLPAIILSAIAFAGLTSPVSAQVTYTPVFSNVWVVTAGHHWDLTNRVDATGTTSRGVGISPVTTNVLFTSTYYNTNSGSAHVSTLSFNNGSNHLGQLNGTGISSGVALLMNVRVSDDGSVYASNRRDGGVNNFTIYRWPSETDMITAPVKVVDAAFTQRLGDHMDVRGSGINTEIVVVGSLASGAAVSTNFFIFRPTDASLTTFTNFSIFIPGNTASAIVSAHGVTFEGTNNAIYVSSGSAVRRVSYNPDTLTASVTRTNATDSANCRALKYYAATNGVEMLACVQYSTTVAAAQVARVFKLPTSFTAALGSVLSSSFPAPYTGSQNGNGLGQVDAKNGYFVFGAPGFGLTLFQVDYTTTAPPSGLTTAISATTIIETYPMIFSASANGTTPLTYQFYFTNAISTNLLVSSTNNIYTNASVSAASVGGYYVIVTNLYGKATSSVVRLTGVLPKKFSNIATQSWALAPGARDYLTTTDTQRGMGYDPINQRLVLVSRAPTNGVHLLDAATGADVGEMDIAFMLGLTPVPGTFALNMCGVAEDGAVYACNLISTATNISSGNYFAIYRWANADTTATMTGAYASSTDGLPGMENTQTFGRIGDTMAVRGAGTSTEIICTFRNTNCVAIFTTGDGSTFTPTIVTITNLPLAGGGLGVAWGKGTNFWVKSNGWNLRRVSYDLTTGIGEVVESNLLPDPEAALAVDTENDYAAIVGFGVTPHNLAIYDITDSANNNVTVNNVVDRELFPTSNANVNGTGAVALDMAGGRIFALDSNNGIQAITYASRPKIAPEGNGGVITWTGPGTLQSSTNLTTGPWVNVPSSSPYTNATGAEFFRVVR